MVSSKATASFNAFFTVYSSELIPQNLSKTGDIFPAIGPSMSSAFGSNAVLKDHVYLRVPGQPPDQHLWIASHHRKANPIGSKCGKAENRGHPCAIFASQLPLKIVIRTLEPLRDQVNVLLLPINGLHTQKPLKPLSRDGEFKSAWQRDCSGH